MTARDPDRRSAPPITEGDVLRHLAWAAGPHVRDGWTPAQDLMLVEGLFAGRALDRVADCIGCTYAAARARWEQLVPPELRGPDWRGVILSNLRWRVGVSTAP